MTDACSQEVHAEGGEQRSYWMYFFEFVGTQGEA
jgi:hypothetical protein